MSLDGYQFFKDIAHDALEQEDIPRHVEYLIRMLRAPGKPPGWQENLAYLVEGLPELIARTENQELLERAQEELMPALCEALPMNLEMLESFAFLLGSRAQLSGPEATLPGAEYLARHIRNHRLTRKVQGQFILLRNVELLCMAEHEEEAYNSAHGVSKVLEKSTPLLRAQMTALLRTALARMHRNKQQNERALEQWLESIRQFELVVEHLKEQGAVAEDFHETFAYLIEALIEAAEASRQRGQRDDAIEMLKKAEKVAGEIDPPIDAASGAIAQNIAQVYQEMGRLDLARTYYQRAIQCYQSDEEFLREEQEAREALENLEAYAAKQASGN